MRNLFGILLFLFLLCKADAQEPFEVTLISDAAKNGNHRFEESIKAEVSALLASRFQLSFTEVYTNGEVAVIENEIARAYAKNQADVLIGAGLITSKLLSDQSTFPIPTIASIQLNNHLHEDPASIKPVSGISNFTYIHSPFNVKAGLEVLKDLCRCEKLAVLTTPNLSTRGAQVEAISAGIDAELEWISLESDLSGTVSSIPKEVGGVYILSPFSSYSLEEIKLFFDQLAERKLPAFTLLDTPMLEQGAYASFAASDNLQKIPRRIALNVEKIAEGEDPKDFPVNMETFTNQLVVNMETVNRIGKYPDWMLLDNALLININRPYTTRVINLKSVIAESIQENLGYQIESKQTQITAKDLALAKSNYLPQLEVESTGLFLDENTVNSSFGTRGSFNWTAGASFSQLILSEPALANIAIQKLLLESQQQVQTESQLDVILEVAQRYFTYLQALSLAELQNNNIKAIHQNLTIATDKQKVGYSGASDVYRWQTELDLAKTDLYQTNAQLKSVGYQLNETLNRPIGEVFSIEDSEQLNQIVENIDQVFLDLIQDQTTLNQLADFLVDEAFKNLPEIQQIQLAVAAQERLLKSNKRSFYLPTIAFGAGYDYPLTIVNPGEPLPIPGFEITATPTWNAAFKLSIPIFSGGSRNFQKQKAEVGLYQLQDQQKEISNLLELQVRANLELVNASYNTIRLTRNAAEAAQKNIAIVQDLYKSGQVNVVTLVDAQNSLLGAQVNATNAAYQFMIDFFALQRSIGNYTMLATEVQNEAFFQRFLNYKTTE